MALTTILLSSAKRMNDAKLLVQSDSKMKNEKNHKFDCDCSQNLSNYIKFKGLITMKFKSMYHESANLLGPMSKFNIPFWTLCGWT